MVKAHEVVGFFGLHSRSFDLFVWKGERPMIQKTEAKMKYRLFYHYKDKEVKQSLMSVCWGLYSHRYQKNNWNIRVLWGLIEMTYRHSKIYK